VAAPVFHLLLCRKGDKLPPYVIQLAKGYNAQLYIANNEKHVRTMLREHPIDMVLIGSGLSAEVRGAMVQAIASIRSDLSIHLNGDVDSGLSFPQFMEKTLSAYLPRH